MKTMRLVLSLTVLLAGAGCVGSGGGLAKAKPAAPDPYLSAAQSANNVELTGSYIKRPVKRNGRITDGPNPVYVIDRETIERSGARDLNQLLILKSLNQ